MRNKVEHSDNHNLIDLTNNGQAKSLLPGQMHDLPLQCSSLTGELWQKANIENIDLQTRA